MTKMHENEIETSAAFVRQLLAAQFPQWAALPIVPISSQKTAGTGNAIYRLGVEKVVRLPRIDWAVGQVEKEHAWLPKLKAELPVTVPNPLVQGEPDKEYPYAWSIYEWLEGENVTFDQLADPCQTARDVAEFLRALQKMKTTGWSLPLPRNTRGNPLASRDKAARVAIAQLTDMFDSAALSAVWEDALAADEWSGAAAWFHGDMLVGNLLFREGQLAAVIDFAALGVGDPACDLMIAWNLFAGESRRVFRETLGIDDATWRRGRGQTLVQAAVFIPYYLHTNPVGVAYARHALEEILAEFAEK